LNEAADQPGPAGLAIRILELIDSPPALEHPLLLAEGELALWQLGTVQALETRRDAAYWATGSPGVALPPRGTLRIAGSRFGGSFVPLRESPAFIDRGRATITTKRVDFEGSWFRREWSFAQLTAVTHAVNQPWTILEAADRPTAFGLAYPREEAALFRALLASAGALYDGRRQELMASLSDQARRPGRPRRWMRASRRRP
jgi:hypothetical protein